MNAEPAPAAAEAEASPPAAPTAALPPLTGHRKVRKTAQQLAKSKKRSQRQKGLRLLREASRNIVAKKVRTNRADAQVIVLNRPEELTFGMRTGLLGHPTTTVLRVQHETLVGALEQGPDKDITEDARRQLGEIATQVGLLTLAALFNYNLAWGPEGLAKKMADWAGIDIEALRAAAAAEAAEEAAEAGPPTSAGTGDGGPSETDASAAGDSQTGDTAGAPDAGLD